jgi:signal transduction histidine kinase
MSDCLYLRKIVFTFFGIVLISCVETIAQRSNSQVFWFFEDTLKRHNFSTIQSDAIPFKRLSNKSLIYNITNSAIWIKFKVSKKDLNQGALFLELSAPTIHYVDFYSPNDYSVYKRLSTGFLRSYYSRGVLSDHFTFPVASDANWYYLRLESGHFLNTDLRIASQSKLSADSNRRHLIYGLYGGILLVIVLIVVAVVVQGKQYHFLFYVCFIFFGSTITLLESGLYFQNIWPNAPIFNYLFPLYTFGVSFSILAFLRYAFNANQLAASLYYFNFWVLTIAPIFPVIYFLCTDHYSLALLVVQVSSMIISFLVLLMTFICFVKSKEFKPYYRLIVTGQILMVLSIAIYLAAQNQWVNLGFIRDLVIMIGGVGEAVCFTMAIFTYQNSTIKKYHGLLRKQNETLKTAVDLRTKELEYKNKDLVVAMQEKDSLLNIVAHDLKSPLNQTKALGNLLLHHTRDEKAMKEMLKRIEQAADHGIRLIEELITISKLEQQNDEVKLERINLSDLLKPMVSNFEIIAAQKRVKINAVIEESIYIKSYPVYLIRIVENLLSNAIKFSSANSKIDFIVDDCSIVIRDYGPGFSNDDLEKVFGKFQRLSARPTAGESSTGLGLYIVKLLTDKLNIRVELRSEPGRGSSFILRF